MANQIYVNLPVKNLEKTIAFFKQLGFEFNPQFTNQDGACMLIGNNIYAMLLQESFFKGFTNKEICDSGKYAEAILAISLDTREDVDKMLQNVTAAGGQEPRPFQDHGWMYARSFTDLDGHNWEIMHIDETAAPQQA